jgi:hypothetical protein
VVVTAAARSGPQAPGARFTLEDLRPTLFVDCKDTLARTARGLKGQDVWQANLDVVAAIERWQAQGAGHVVLWSERGADEAERWRKAIIPQLMAIECLARDARLPRPGDVLIAAVAMHASGTRYAPEQSFMVAPAQA